MILRLVLTGWLIWHVWLGDRWALAVTLTLIALHGEIVSYLLKRKKDSDAVEIKNALKRMRNAAMRNK